MPTLYQILIVPENAGLTEIKRSFRRLSMQYHPDRNPGDAAAEARFREILEAYRILSDQDERIRYDRQLSWSRIPATPPPATGRTPPQRSNPYTEYRRSAHAGAPPQQGPPKPLPWRFMAVILSVMILFFVGLYKFAPKPKDNNEELRMPDTQMLPKNVSATDNIHFTDGKVQQYEDWRYSFRQLPFTESWEHFGNKSEEALYVTIYFSPDRHIYQDYVFMREENGGLRQIFRYEGGTYRTGAQLKLFFGRDVEEGDCDDCEFPGLPNPGIAGIYLEETGGGYAFEAVTGLHEKKIRENLNWLQTAPLTKDFEMEYRMREYLRQVLTWHFLHRNDSSAEALFREYYQQEDADVRWHKIERLIEVYENKIASDVVMRTEAI